MSDVICVVVGCIKHLLQLPFLALLLYIYGSNRINTIIKEIYMESIASVFSLCFIGVKFLCKK